MPPRSQRRREARAAGGGPSGPTNAGVFGRRELIGALCAAGGVLVVILAAVLLSGGGSESRPSSTAAPSAPAAFSPTTPDGEAIVALARRSIEALPRGQWPSLYDDFTPEFQQRCARAEFAQAGVQAGQDLGADLALLRFKRLEQVSIQTGSASAVIVGELEGRSEYSLQGAFQNVGGVWKLAPAPNTQGCQAFTRLSG